MCTTADSNVYYQNVKLEDIDRKHAKILLGAQSRMYDKQLERLNYNPAGLREICDSVYAGACQPVSDSLYKTFAELYPCSFNLFHAYPISYIQDPNDSKYVDTLSEYIGFFVRITPIPKIKMRRSDKYNISQSLPSHSDNSLVLIDIYTVKITEYISGDKSYDTEYSISKKQRINLLDAFHLYGTKLFYYITCVAAIVDYRTMIDAFNHENQASIKLQSSFNQASIKLQLSFNQASIKLQSNHSSIIINN